MNPNNIQAPTFSAGALSSQAQHAVSTRGTPATLNLDDIFGDCFFTPEGDAVFLSEQQQQQNTSNNNNNNNVNDVSSFNNTSAIAESMNIQLSGEANPSSIASRPVPMPLQQTQPNNNNTNTPNPNPTQTQFAPVAQAGGIATTGLAQTGARATAMGPATADTLQHQKLNPMVAPPQQRHHLQFATTIPSTGGSVTVTGSGGSGVTTTSAPITTGSVGSIGLGGVGTKKRGGASARERKMSDQQKSERRERNREHAKRSRIRKKILLESLQQSVALLKEENDKLRSSIRQHLGDPAANELLTKENLANTNVSSLIASNSKDANKVLDDPDFSFIKALQTAQQNFVVTDPSLPDNPIVYATQGFLNLTGYSLDQVLGRNCRFLQGPETDPKAVEKIRRSIEEGSDMSVCLLNYRVDGTTFWNQFFISALRDAAGNITNYVGVQCKVSDQYAANVCKKQEEEFANVDTAVESANVNVNTNMPTNYTNTTMNVVADGGNANTNVDANLNVDATGGSTTIMDGGAVAPVTGGTNMAMAAGGTTTMDNGGNQTGMEGVTSTTAAATSSADAPAGDMTVSMNHIKVEPTQPNTGVTGGSGAVEEGNTTTSTATITQTMDGAGDTTMQ